MKGDVDVRHLDVVRHGREPPLYWGMWGLITVEAIVFASLVTTYLYLQLLAVEWPPAGVSPPSLTLSTVNTAVLLASIPFVRLADRGVTKDRRGYLIVGLAGSLLLALGFLAIKFVEFSKFGFRWDSHAYGSSVFALLGFHTAHVIVLALKTIVVLALAVRGYWQPWRDVGVQVNGIYWYFVVAVWIPLYFLVFISPRLL